MFFWFWYTSNVKDGYMKKILYYSILIWRETTFHYSLPNPLDLPSSLTCYDNFKCEYLWHRNSTSKEERERYLCFCFRQMPVLPNVPILANLICPNSFLSFPVAYDLHVALKVTWEDLDAYCHQFCRGHWRGKKNPLLRCDGSLAPFCFWMTSQFNF